MTPRVPIPFVCTRDGVVGIGNVRNASFAPSVATSHCINQLFTPPRSITELGEICAVTIAKPGGKRPNGSALLKAAPSSAQRLPVVEAANRIVDVTGPGPLRK